MNARTHWSMEWYKGNHSGYLCPPMKYPGKGCHWEQPCQLSINSPVLRFFFIELSNRFLIITESS